MFSFFYQTYNHQYLMVLHSVPNLKDGRHPHMYIFDIKPDQSGRMCPYNFFQSDEFQTQQVPEGFNKSHYLTSSV